jgi:hypothetical protein
MERLPTALFCKLAAVPPPGSEYNVAPHSLIRFAAVLYDPFLTLGNIGSIVFGWWFARLIVTSVFQSVRTPKSGGLPKYLANSSAALMYRPYDILSVVTTLEFLRHVLSEMVTGTSL